MADFLRRFRRVAHYFDPNDLVPNVPRSTVEEAAATKIQSLVRGFLQRKRFGLMLAFQNDAFFHAVLEENIPLVRKHLRYVNMKDNEGLTPLHYAVLYNKNSTVLKLLLSVEGVRVDLKDKKGQTALHKAVTVRKTPYGVKLEMAKLLLAAGANVDAMNNRRVSAHTLAASNGHIECAALLSRAGRRRRQLML